ncbi:hypothetical protein FOZ61_010752 [Perkinsus olseni]|uniref:Integrase zinc-binding domain-containing protein n=1 Tax=Perkinsus olseni TaxID=32597 RepID=A0A7J6KVL1_PEROL|nr:hypothetical protein FOZ61_010752 [Perkinsus olseni]
MEAHLGAAAIPLKPIRAYNLESCDVKEYLDVEGRTHTVLEAPDCTAVRRPSLDDFKKSVAEVRNVLSQNGLKTKDPVDLNGAHLLGLEIYQDDTGTLLWRRRLPLESLLESIEARFDKPPLLTAREVGSWLGKLVAHVPCAGYLRVCVAVGRRLLNHSCGRDRSAWSRPVADDVRDYVKKLCSVIRQSGDPAFGRWLLPESSEKIRCWVDASQLAEAVLLTDSANLILADGAWLAPTGDVGSAGAAVFVNSWGGEGVQNHWWPDNSDLLEAQASEDIDCEVSSKFDLRDGLVYYDGLPYLPASLRRRVILSLHQSLLHPGRSSTASTLKEYFRFPNLDVEVENALESCTDEICQRGRRKPVSLSTETCRRLATEPWSCVGVDITYVHSVPVLSCICDYSSLAINPSFKRNNVGSLEWPSRLSQWIPKKLTLLPLTVRQKLKKTSFMMKFLMSPGMTLVQVYYLLVHLKNIVLQMLMFLGEEIVIPQFGSFLVAIHEKSVLMKKDILSSLSLD